MGSDARPSIRVHGSFRYKPWPLSSDRPFRNPCNGAACKLHQIFEVKTEHCIRRPGRSPNLIEATQIFIDDDEHRFGVTDRGHAPDGEASAVADKVGVGAFNRFTEMRCDDGLMHPVRSAGDDHHGSIADGRSEHQRLGDLPYCAANRCRGLGSRAGRCLKLHHLEARAEHTLDSQRSAMRGWFHADNSPIT